MESRKHYKPLLLMLAVAMLVVSGFSQSRLNRDRAELGLTNSKPLENAPPVLAFTTVALGGFRGIIANILWVRANQLQIDGKYFELIQLSDWITKLQPRMATVWRFHAWNLAYNIPVKFPNNNDRWPWVKRGVEMIRDEALRYNPHSIELYQEIGVIYQHKMGGNSDDAHLHYKYELASLMEDALGGPKPDYQILLDPRTEEQKARVKHLKEDLKLDPVIMKEVDDKYGPLEWRLPETHAIYWSVVGMKQTTQEDKLILRRTIYQSMQLAVQRGHMMVFPVTEDRNGIEFGPNIEMIPNANRVYEEAMAEEKNAEEHIGTGHRNFLNRAVFDLYMHNRMTAAKQWFEYLKKKYPFETELYNTVDDYVLNRFIEEVGYEKPDQINATKDRATAIVEGFITKYYHYLAIGEDDQAAGSRNYAKRVWLTHMEKINQPKMEKIVERLKIAPYPQIEEQVLARMFYSGELTPLLQARLLTALGRKEPPARPALQESVKGAAPEPEAARNDPDAVRKMEEERKKKQQNP